jgi:hypothetical protein
MNEDKQCAFQSRTPIGARYPLHVLFGSTSLYEGSNAPWIRTFEVMPAKTLDGDGLPRSVNPAYLDTTGIVDVRARARTTQHVKVVDTHGDARNFGYLKS